MSDSCGNPATETEALMPRRRKFDKTKICVKCKTNPGSLIIRHAVYCKECFVPLTTHKFRRSLEPFVNAKPDGPRRTALKPQGNLLVGFSGGLGSTVLLDLVHRYYVVPDKALIQDDGGSHHPRHERVWKRVVVGYVEVCDAFPSMVERMSDVRAIMEGYGGFEFVPLRIQDAFDPCWWKKIGRDPVNLGVDMTDEALKLLRLEESTSPLEAMRSYMASLPTTTARSTALQTLTRVLLQYTAQANDCSHLVLGTSLTSLAVSLISGVAHGGGFHVREEMQEEWTADQSSDREVDVAKKATKRHGLRIIRPLRDVGMKECGAWSWWMGLKVVGRENWEWPGFKPGIGALTKAFIVGLEKDYPSTVSTIVRTCGKLSPKGIVEGKCISCERPIQSGIQDWQARISIRSRHNGDEQAPFEEVAESLSPFLCYPCRITLTSRSTRPILNPFPNSNHDVSLTPLPMWTGRVLHPPKTSGSEEGDAEIVVGRTLARSEMKNAVKEFLLQDE
ncbi:hypothetical protein EIP91_002938 [Steccherinum ochraceum]|uniref:Cytoplasmic tRNA 2-thiolation protein 2 n=1 Tax=Steccherinum ochraceum TaxID=92696 RepID=A0A4R0RB62_9APHY|nr:hypothetical protein EIP91_002938 [Steccherinum ochraceum]